MERGELDLAHYDADTYKNRMTYEMLIIDKMGYCDYYLIVRDFVLYAKGQEIPTGPGRGSGAGSLVAYLVGITEIDPIRYGLLFERFLNLQRISMPDFDIDFCYNRRDEVVRYVEEKYGKDRVTKIISFGTLAARAAVRDVGKALGMSYEEVDKVAKLVPRELNITLRKAMEQVPALSEEYRKNAKTRRLLDTSMAVEGMPRHITTHAAGIVITGEKVSSYIPLAVSGDVVLSQFVKDDLEKLGLLKFDFLALRYLTVIAEAERLVRQREPAFRIEKIPLDDSESYALLAKGDSEGVFQLESPGMRRLLVSMRPRCIEDIMIALALYRPGPMDSIPKYLARRENPAKVSYEIEAVREILEETGGCIIYQEQVMQIFRKVAGYSYGKADVVRKAIAKKHPEQMEQERESFLSGAERNRIPRDAANRLFDEMVSFADYAFNKSHAAAYSYLSYRTAYLKAHYRTAYFAALLTSVQNSAEKMAEYIADCEKAGITALPPDLSVSECGFTAEGDLSRGAIRYGLCGIKGVGEGLAKALCEERSKGKFTSFRDLLTRMNGKGLGRVQVQSMIYAGAMDCFGMRRSQLLEAAEPLLAEINDSARRNLDGQTGFLDALPGRIRRIPFRGSSGSAAKDPCPAGEGSHGTEFLRLFDGGVFRHAEKNKSLADLRRFAGGQRGKRQHPG